MGDAINWETLLQHARGGDRLHLVSGDTDYVSTLDGKSLKEFLSREWKSKLSSELYFYRTMSDFFRSNYPDIRLASEVEKDVLIDRLFKSGSFRDTHEIIAQLKTHIDFSAPQIERLVSILNSNPQVGWIINDPDLRGFYGDLYANHGDEMDLALSDTLVKLMGTDVDDAEENIPF